MRLRCKYGQSATKTQSVERVASDSLHHSNRGTVRSLSTIAKMKYHTGVHTVVHESREGAPPDCRVVPTDCVFMHPASKKTPEHEHEH